MLWWTTLPYILGRCGAFAGALIVESDIVPRSDLGGASKLGMQDNEHLPKLDI